MLNHSTTGETGSTTTTPPIWVEIASIPDSAFDKARAWDWFPRTWKEGEGHYGLISPLSGRTYRLLVDPPAVPSRIACDCDSRIHCYHMAGLLTEMISETLFQISAEEALAL